mgnify:CR=1 FL=1
MCLIVKIAANCPLPTAPVDPERRRIAVLDLNNWPGDGSYTRWMTLPFVYEVTSRYGCGCDLRLSRSDAWALTDENAGEEEEISARGTLEDWQRVVDYGPAPWNCLPLPTASCQQSKWSRAGE